MIEILTVCRGTVATSGKWLLHRAVQQY